MRSRIKNRSFKFYEEIESNSREFMDLATGVLERCYRINENYAHDLLIGDLLEWKKASCILIAMKTKNEEFMSANACQEVFNNIWMGEITQANGILKLLTCIFIPPLIPCLVKFEKNTDNGPDPSDNTISGTEQEDQATGGSSPNVSLQQSQPSLHSQGTKDDVLEETNNDSGDDNRQETKDDVGEETNNDSGDDNRQETRDDVGEETNDDSGDDNRQGTKDGLGDETKLIKYFSEVKKPISLFYRAPVVIFLSHVISYMAFLCLYSYILISKFDQKLSMEDIILTVWVANILIEEIRQVISTRSMYTEIKPKAYMANIWNIADIITISLFVLGMILKHLPYPETLEIARVFLSVNLITFFLRLLQIFSMNKELGPRLAMISLMVRNLTSFVLMFLIFIVAYAIASHAILYPNTEISFNLLRVIFRRPYWNIYGELMLDEIEGTNDCTNIEELYRNGTQPRCPTESGKYFMPVLMGVYMLMCNILLLNLLISIFSYTFQTVQEKSDMHWRIERYHHILEYINRPSLVPPFSFIENVFQIIKFLINCRCRCKPENCTSGTNVFLQPFSDEDEDERKHLREWERDIACTIINSKQADLESIDNRVKAISLRLDRIVSKLDDLQEQQHAGNATIEDARLCPSQNDSQSERESSTVVESVSVNLDKRMENIEKKLQWLVDTLKEHHSGAEQSSPEKPDERAED